MTKLPCSQLIMQQKSGWQKCLWQKCYGKSPWSPPWCTGIICWWHSHPSSRVSSFSLQAAPGIHYSLDCSLKGGSLTQWLWRRQTCVCLSLSTCVTSPPPSTFLHPSKTSLENRVTMPTYQAVWGVSRMPFGNTLGRKPGGYMFCKCWLSVNLQLLLKLPQPGGSSFLCWMGLGLLFVVHTDFSIHSQCMRPIFWEVQSALRSQWPERSAMYPGLTGSYWEN